MERGDLNKRCEYTSNEICRLAPVISLYEVEKEGRELAAERGMMDERCRDFVNVMSSVLNNKHQNSTPLPNENIFCFRQKDKRKNSAAMEDVDGAPKMKLKRLNSYQTSTPLTRREQQPVIFSDQDTSVSTFSSRFSDWSMTGVNKSPTQVSLDMERNKLTPPKPESKSLELKRILTTTISWDTAAQANGLIRSTSLPVILDLKENTFYNNFPM